MVQTMDRSRGEAVAQVVPSELVISAVPGEYYTYSSEFTDERPLYVLLKCKSNKSRPVADAGSLGREANMLFLLNDWTQAQVYSIKEAYSLGLLGDAVNAQLFDDTWVACAGITDDYFYDIRSRKDVAMLVETCKKACSEHSVSVPLSQGSIIAVMTSGGKYGLFLVKELTPTSIQIDACHILL